MMHGEGTYKWLDGRMYHGSYNNDKKDGFGVYVWADGRAYIGKWVAGKQADERVYILPNGTVRKGIWENGQRKEWLEITPEEEQIYKGHLNDAVKKGEEVDSTRREAEAQFQRMKRGQYVQQEQHYQEQLPEGIVVTDKLQQLAQQDHVQHDE